MRAALEVVGDGSTALVWARLVADAAMASGHAATPTLARRIAREIQSSMICVERALLAAAAKAAR